MPMPNITQHTKLAGSAHFRGKKFFEGYSPNGMQSLLSYIRTVTQPFFKLPYM